MEGIKFRQEPSTSLTHTNISLGKIKQTLVAIGSWLGQNLAVEIFENEKWTRVNDFPNSDLEYIAYYSTVTVEDELYIIGE